LVLSGFDPASLSVMVVDDTKLMRDVTLAYLRRYGIGHCSAYADGQEALEALAFDQFRPDLVITDLNMPVMDGIEVLRPRRAAFPGPGGADFGRESPAAAHRRDAGPRP